jgi:hypothetical protein
VSLFEKVVGGAWILIGLVFFVPAAVSLTTGRAGPEMAGPAARRKAWKSLRGALRPMAFGVAFMVRGDPYGWIVISAMVSVLVIWEIAARLIARRRPLPDPPAVDEPAAARA